MMFQATLDSVAFQLEDAAETTRFAIGQLSTITGLTWRSAAGKAFARQVGELGERLENLSRVLTEAEEYLGMARQEIQQLEAEIVAQRAA